MLAYGHVRHLPAMGLLATSMHPPVLISRTVHPLRVDDPLGEHPQEQAVAVPLADSQPIKESPVKVRAMMTLDLAAEDAAKADRFSESRRAARLKRRWPVTT
jgi:hypothetical protein